MNWVITGAIVAAALYLGITAWRNRTGWQASLLIGLFVITWGLAALGYGIGSLSKASETP